MVAERAVEAVVGVERRQERGEPPLEELRPVGVVRELPPGVRCDSADGFALTLRSHGAARMGRESSARYAASSRTTGTAPTSGSPPAPVAPIITRRSARMVRGSGSVTSRRRSGRIDPSGRSGSLATVKNRLPSSLASRTYRTGAHDIA